MPCVRRLREGVRRADTLRNVSFRRRLALFFVVIVVVPMLAVSFMVMRLIETRAQGQADAEISAQHTVAGRMFGEVQGASAAALDVVLRDRVFGSSLQRGNIPRAQKRAGQLLGRGIERIIVVRDGEPVVDAGDRRAVAPASRDAVSAAGTPVGRVEVSVVDAATYARRVWSLTGLDVVVLNGGVVLSSTLPAARPGSLPTASRGTLTIAGTEYRAQSFAHTDAFAGQRVRVITLGSLDAGKGAAGVTSTRWFAAGVLLGFLLLAIACAVVVSRALQRQIASFLAAARKLAGGDLSAKVPIVGNDEFAELGREFNKMSGELEHQIEELGQEHERLLGSMRRLGQAVASNLDRDALLEIVVRTAVDGLDAHAGRASVRPNGGEELEVRTRVGNMNGLEGIVASVEAAALRSGRPRQTTSGSTTAVANPLRGKDRPDKVIGVVSVVRSGGTFTPNDRALFDYLATRIGRSIENVELHETAARESVTDELTGLFNRRSFDDTLASEIERAKRFGGRPRPRVRRPRRLQAHQRRIRPPAGRPRAARGRRGCCARARARSTIPPATAARSWP